MTSIIILIFIIFIIYIVNINTNNKNLKKNKNFDIVYVNVPKNIYEYQFDKKNKIIGNLFEKDNIKIK